MFLLFYFIGVLEFVLGRESISRYCRSFGIVDLDGD